MNRRTNTIVTVSLIVGAFVWLFAQPIIPFYFDWGTFIFVFFVFFMAAIGVYYFVNPERDARLKKEEKEEKRKIAVSNRTSCSGCGVVVEGKQCPNCKIPNPNLIKKSYKGMYALSILLGFIGGIIAWASLRNENPSVGVNCLILGIVVTIASIGIGAVFLN